MTSDPTSREPDFRVCTECGNQTPAEWPNCIHCGRQSVAAMAEHQEEGRERRFIDAFLTRSNPFALIIIGINAGLFLLEWLAGGMSMTAADSLVIRGFGAKSNYLINQHHEYWRLVT